MKDEITMEQDIKPSRDTDYDPGKTPIEVIEDSIEGMMMAAKFIDDSLPINIVRKIDGKEKSVMRFIIHPLDETTLKKARNQATKPKWNESTGKTPKMEFNEELFEAYLIYYATDSEDRKRLWDDQNAMQRLGVQLSTALIQKVFKPGEKTLLARQISKFSGYEGDSDDLVDTAKN